MKIPHLQNLLVTVLFAGCLLALAPLTHAGVDVYLPQASSSQSLAS